MLPKVRGADGDQEENSIDERPDVGSQGILNHVDPDTHHPGKEAPYERLAGAPREGTGIEAEIARYPSTLRASLLTVGLCLVTFATAVDNTIIGECQSLSYFLLLHLRIGLLANTSLYRLATAIPRITTEFHSLDDVGWYASSYLLASAAVQPSYGKVYSHFDVKWTYLTALVIFEVGSVVAATANSSVVLIIGRAIAGLGGGGLTSGGSTILALAVPIHKRAIFNSTFASTFGSEFLHLSRRHLRLLTLY